MSNTQIDLIIQISTIDIMAFTDYNKGKEVLVANGVEI